MTKADLLQLLEPFNNDIRVLVKDRDAPNADLQAPTARYLVKRGSLRLRDDSLLESGEGYIELTIQKAEGRPE